MRCKADTNAPSIAIIPFENLSHQRNAGLIMTDLATTALYANKHCRVVDVSGVQNEKETSYRRIEVVPWERQVGANIDSAVAIGRRLGAEYVLVGSVGEYGFIDGFGETATVGLNLRLVRVEGQQVAWAGSMSKRMICTVFDEESAHRLAHKVVLDLLGKMDSQTHCCRECAAQTGK
jgi:TolB-like protein